MHSGLPYCSSKQSFTIIIIIAHIDIVLTAIWYIVQLYVHSD